MISKAIVQALFRRAGVACNGPADCDPQIYDDRFYQRVLLHGSIGLGESYMDGWWSCRRVDLFICRLLESGLTDLVPRLDDLRLKLWSLFVDRQDRTRSRRVADEHYNESPDFFMGILGDTNSYTCGRWDGVDTLDAAQTQKMDLLCRKARLVPGERVLDIGCGWGGFLGYATEKYGVNGVGLSISKPQLDHARNRYGNLPIEFREQDYRDFDGTVDKAVSICMIEHVGPKHYREYFSMVRKALPENGIFALQCILSHRKRSMNDPWVDKYIFPGGNLVTMGRLQEAIKGLFHVVDSEFFGHDYVKTLTAWCDNLRARRDSIVAQYGIEHFRKYEYYFLAFVGGFMSKRITVGQFVLCPTDLGSSYQPVRL